MTTDMCTKGAITFINVTFSNFALVHENNKYL